MAKKALKKVLLIGGGANDFGRESELDVATHQVMHTFADLGIATILIDDNPYSLSLEDSHATTYIQPITVENVRNIIEFEQPDAVYPAVGGTTAFQVLGDLFAQFDYPNLEILGMSLDTVNMVNNPALLAKRLRQIGEPVISSQVVNSVEAAFDIAREIGFPVNIKPMAPKFEASRHTAEDSETLDLVLKIALKQSRIKQVVISQGINGLREVGVQVMRDHHDVNMLIGAVEDMDPVGIHAADSILVTPVQTLSDREFQRLRMAAFRIMRGLDIVGTAHIQFALDPRTDRYYIIKVSPYFDSTSTLVSRSTGYPLAIVAAHVCVNINLTRIVLPNNFAKKMAIIEPVMDRIVVKFPVFAFGEIENAGIKVNRRLNTMQKSAGSTIGIGRSIEEALEKAIRAAHFSNRVFSPDLMSALPENDLIQQLIHPRDNRILLLIEALRRGYTIDELAELTKIDEYYFYKLQNIMELERAVKRNPGDLALLQDAKYYGLSDGLIAKLWNQDFDDVRQLAKNNDLQPTFKAIEPSAGEFPEDVTVYYSTFEQENESERLGDKSVLVVGTGAFRLGDGASGSYVTSTILDEIRANGFQSIIINNNPNDLTLMIQFADKQYIEPLEISDIMNVVELEQPAFVLVPGNRIKLIAALRERNVHVCVIPKDKYTAPGPQHDEREFAINYYFDGTDVHPITITEHVTGKLMFDKNVYTQIYQQKIPKLQLRDTSPGLYQLITNQLPLSTDLGEYQLRPVPFGQIAFLNKVTGINWIRLMIRNILGCQTDADKVLLARLPDVNFKHQVAEMVSNNTDFFQHLQPAGELDSTQFEMGVAMHLIK
ncbi:carbamoyl-phosphate synthase large subunit [Periweissella fabaria]|uniref:carbamoyl-phosphate synthase (ammonia) n=1 Tax=Periweissella fabaria TaxID=546157 RepID=A0ABM8Z3E7_9LACO|nr:carbamoyl-phosphate synthase large subunit [Periweissella fabaria]MCM0596502.1 carbamoyl-phosphate synthase large subunit [Periweissella fabaria]CAH0415769.1 Carbamoyl-phosphate synthase large chain [Periweissella fabaria]